MLTGRPVRLIDRNGAPAGERHVLLVDPPVIEPASGARGSAVTLAQRWALPFLRAGRQTIVFGRSRVAVEIMLTGLRESLRESYGPRTPDPRLPRRLPADRAAGDRAWAARRRDPRRRRRRTRWSSASTSGGWMRRSWPATRARSPGPGSSSAGPAGAWARASRSWSRRGAPVDQYVIHHPEFLLEGTPEEARLDPDNLHVLLAHLRARHVRAAVRAGRGVRTGPGGRPARVPRRGAATSARPTTGAGTGRRENFPASEISLRTAAPENVVIIDTTPDRPRVLGEVDLFSAQVLVHERAIYIHESVQYYVDRLEWGERKAYVHKIDVDHYTYANRAVTLKPLEVFAEAPATGGRRVHGEVMVASLVTLFKKLKFVTDENVGWGPIDLPELELQTTAYWLTADAAAGHWRRDELDVALLGAGRAIQTVAAVLLMVDPRDLGLVTQVRSPHPRQPTIYLYEAVPGGIGLRERLLAAPRRARRRALPALIAACGCDGGCPACTGPAARARGRCQAPRPAAARASSAAARGDAAAPEPAAAVA